MKLSIVTVSFNAEYCIERTILSVLNQTKSVYEYILIDGGSKDQTYTIIKSYEKAFANKGIRFIHQSEPDKGISDAFNKGITQATGDVVGIINADDELMPVTNEILCREFEKTAADVYYGNCLWIDTDRGTEHISKPKHDLKQLLYYMILIHPSTFVCKSAYDKYGVFNITYRYCMDKELLYRFYKRGAKFDYIDETLAKFKSGGVSDRNARKVIEEGTRLSIENGEPYIKAKMIEIKKRAKNFAAQNLKKTILYDKLKKTQKCNK